MDPMGYLINYILLCELEENKQQPESDFAMFMMFMPSLLGWIFFLKHHRALTDSKWCFFAHHLLGCLYVMLIPEDQSANECKPLSTSIFCSPTPGTCSSIEISTHQIFSGEDHREWEVGLNWMMICMVLFCWPLQNKMFLLTFLTGHWHPTYIICTQNQPKKNGRGCISYDFGFGIRMDSSKDTRDSTKKHVITLWGLLHLCILGHSKATLGGVCLSTRFPGDFVEVVSKCRRSFMA